jgi:hypothetical protein
MSAGSVHSVDQFFLLKIFESSIPFFHLKAQIDRLERGEPPHALAALPPPPDRVDLRCVARVGHFRLFMIAKRTSHKDLIGSSNGLAA